MDADRPVIGTADRHRTAVLVELLGCDLAGEAQRAARAAFAAQHHARLGQFGQAIEAAVAALTLIPSRPPAIEREGCSSWLHAVDDLAAALVILGAHAEAAELVETATAWHPARLAAIHLSWALTHEALSEAGPAVKHLELVAGLASRSGDPSQPCCRPLVAAAAALRWPHVVTARAVDAMATAAGHACYTVDVRAVLALAAGRCRRAAGEVAAAESILLASLIELNTSITDPAIRLALLREVAQLRDDPALRGSPSSAELLLFRCLFEQAHALRAAQRAAFDLARDRQHLRDVSTRAHRQAHEDPLTGLANRRAADQHLQDLAARPGPAAVAVIDLDGFKAVNDTRSHAAGDIVLREVAVRLRASLRRHDIVARYGGDEFVAIMPDTALPAADTALRRAVTAIASLPREVSGGVTLSIGVVHASGAPREVIARADAAMYAAKRAGGNRVVTA